MIHHALSSMNTGAGKPVGKARVSVEDRFFEKPAYQGGSLPMAATSQLFSPVVDLWEAKKPSTLDDLMQVANRIRLIDSSLNLAIVDMRPRNPSAFCIEIIYEAGTGSSLHHAYPHGKTLGGHPDPEFSKKFLLPTFHRVLQDKKLRIDLVCAKVLGCLTSYDQLILPMEIPQSDIDYALAVINMRFIVPAERASCKLGSQDWMILQLLSTGMSCAGVARKLAIPYHQTKTAVDGIVAKLAARNITHAVALAMASDIVSEPAKSNNNTLVSVPSSARIPVDFSGNNREGLVLVDASARLLSANTAARDIMARGGLRVDNDSVRTEIASETKMLHGLIRECSRGEAGAQLNYAIAARDGRPALSLLVKCLANQCTHASGENEAIIGIFIADPERIPVPAPAQLQQQFGLTPSEALVALEILSTDGVPATAARLGITIGTVKTHLIRIFSKTGTRRQSELVRLLLAIGHSSNCHAG